LREEPGTDEGKVYNLVRGLEKEVHEATDTAPLLRPLTERAQRIVKDLEDRNISGLAAFNLLESLAAEKEAALIAMRESGLTPRAFNVYWVLKDDTDLAQAHIDPRSLAAKVDELASRYPNARVNPDEDRGLRRALYGPLIQLAGHIRKSVAYRIIATLFDGEPDAE
jgi:type I restriction enzyme R subunit